MKNNNHTQLHSFHRLHRVLHIIIMIIAVGALATFVSVLQPSLTNAGTSDNVTGWAWIGVAGGGWVSLNCVDEGTCGSANYGVNIDNSGNWSGSGWSSTLGWVDFSGGACGGGTQTNMSSGDTTGWAHVRSFSSTEGGFSGCINMAGSGNNYSASDGVSIDMLNGQMSGYAWSGDDVAADVDGDGTLDWTLDGSPDVGLGWIDFSFAQVDLDEGSSVDLYENSFNGSCGSDAEFSWDLESVNEADCELTVEDVVAGTIVATIPIDATAVSSYSYPINSGQYRFTLSCPDVDNSTIAVGSNNITLTCGTAPQCNDNDDNDGDGDEDFDDPSCHDNCVVTTNGTYNPNYSESRTCTGSDACLLNPNSPLCAASGGIPPIIEEN